MSDTGIAGMVGRLRCSLRTVRRPHSIAGLLRMWWHDFVIHPLFQGTEICEDCGRQYPLWSAPQVMWTQVMGGAWGLLCPSCFSNRMDRRGVIVEFLAMPFDRSNPGRWRELLDSVNSSSRSSDKK